MNLPNWLTLFRLILIPIVVGMLFVRMPAFSIAASVVFGIALATDWLDGFLARRWNQTSAFGAFLDPVADKLIVCAVLVMLVYRDPQWFIALPASVIVGRELTISALREWMAELGKRGVVSVSSLGKYKTAVQMLAIFLMVFDIFDKDRLYITGATLLSVSAALTLWSMIIYLKDAWPTLSNERQQAK